LTGGEGEQSILEAIKEKHESTKTDVSASPDERRRLDDVQGQQDESAFRQFLQKSPRELELRASAKHDHDANQN
jgi:hypothetical protein